MSIHWLGYAGTALVMVAYLPQVTHLVRERCSAGISFGAYASWTLAAVLLLIYATVKRDPVFMALQGYQVVALATVCAFSKKFQHHLCEIHGGPIHPSTHRWWVAWRTRT